MAGQSRTQSGYWQAQGLIELALSRFHSAHEKNRPAEQRRAFYRLANYHGRTLRVLNSALHRQDEPLTQAALHNLQALHRGMMQMHRAAPHVVPLPIALSTHSRHDFVRDLIMRVLAETPPALPVDAIHTRANHLDLLGNVALEDVHEHLRALAHAEHVAQEEAGFVRSTRVYDELDKDVAGLRALIGRTFFARFAERGYDSLGAVEEQVAAFRTDFAELTGMDDPATADHFLDTVYALLDTSVAASEVWRHRDLLHSTYPRPYQRAAYSAFRREDYHSLVVDAPTGSGKTLIGMLCIQDWLRTLDRGQSILILVPTSNYQQQWLAELCYHPRGLQLAPEVVFSGSPHDYARYQELTGARPAVLILTYSALAQLGSPVGKGGFDAQSIEIFLQQANVHQVILDEVHKVAEKMDSTTADVTRLLVQWQRDTTLRGLIGFSGTAQAYRRRLEALGLTLCYSVPIDDLVAAGFVAPFAELGVPSAFSAREQRIRELLNAYKAALQDYFSLLGPATLRTWFAGIPLETRLFLGHEVLGMYRGRSDWRETLTSRFGAWEDGDTKALKLTEAHMVSLIQLANDWSDADLARQAGADAASFQDLVSRVDTVKSELAALVYLPKTLARLQTPNFARHLPGAELRALPQSDLAQSARPDAAKDLLAATIVGLYDGLSDWYLRTGEGRVAAIKAVVEAERAVRDISGVIVFDRGRHLNWRHGVDMPGYEGVAGLFSELLGDERFTVMAALSNEMYFTYDPARPVTVQIADFIRDRLMKGDVADAMFNLFVAGLDLPDAAVTTLRDEFLAHLIDFADTLEHMHAVRLGAFNAKVLRPLQRVVRRMNLGLTGERLLARLDRRNADLKRLITTFFDYSLLAVHFREAHVAEAEQVSGARRHFQVVTMPSGARRKQLMYDLTARIVDAAELPVNFVIVSDWARTGWNVIRPNLLIDATATRNVTAWQQLRGRAIRAWPTWTNDCYRLLSVLVGHHLLTGVETEPDTDGDLDGGLRALLAEVATPAQMAHLGATSVHGLQSAEREALAVALLRRYNKVTHIYELVKATGSTGQVIYNRVEKRWERREAIAAKHGREVAVNPFTGVKSTDVDHAPLVYAEDPRTDVPQAVQRQLEEVLAGCDDVIVCGWLNG